MLNYAKYLLYTMSHLHADLLRKLVTKSSCHLDSALNSSRNLTHSVLRCVCIAHLHSSNAVLFLLNILFLYRLLWISQHSADKFSLISRKRTNLCHLNTHGARFRPGKNVSSVFVYKYATEEQNYVQLMVLCVSYSKTGTWNSEALFVIIITEWIIATIKYVIFD